MPEEADDGKGGEVEVTLKRDLGLFEVLMIGLGPTLGSTIFLLVGFGLEIAGPGLVLVFILNFIVTIFTAMAYAELSSAFPDTGGGYLWVKEGLPQPIGFLAGWMSWFGHCIVTSFYVFGFGKGVLWILEANGVDPSTAIGIDGDMLVKALAVGVCLVFIGINYRGTKETGKSGIVITVILIAIISTFLIAGAFYILQNPASEGDVSEVVTEAIPNGWGSILIAMGFTFIVFEGYEIISQCGEECKDPLVNVPKASWLCIIISTIIFVLVAIVCVGVMDWTTVGEGAGMVPGDDAVAHVASITLPAFGIELIAIGVILGTLAAINSTLFSSSRVSFAMGRDGALPASFGHLNKRRHTPHVAIFTSGAIVIGMTIFLPIQDIAASADIMFLLLFFFVNLAAITLRYKRPDIKRHYVMPFFPWVPIIGIGTKFVLAVGLWKEFPVAWFIALGWIEIGLLAFYLYGGKEKIEETEIGGIDFRTSEAGKDREKTNGKDKILVPVNDEGQKHLVKFAARVAKERNADLLILKVIETPRAVPLESLGYRDLGPHIKLVEKMKKRAERRHVKTRGRVLIAHMAADAILDATADENIKLLIIGFKGTGKPGRIFGKNIDKMVRAAECDVIVFKSRNMPEKLRHILVVSTPEWHTSFATNYAILLAKEHGASMSLVSLCPDEAGKKIEEPYMERLSALCADNDIEYRSDIIMTGSIEDTIHKLMEKHDMLVFGAADEREQKKFAMGKIQDRLALNVEKPVLMIRKVRSVEDSGNQD